MIPLGGLVWLVAALIVGAIVLGLLWFLIDYCAANIGGPPKVWAIVRVVFVVAVVLFCIFLLISLVDRQPLFRP